MKTKYQKMMSWTVWTGLAVLGMCSCSKTNYRMLTTVHPNGACLREIYAQGDSAFAAGDWSENPYLFRLDSSWQITPIIDHHTKQKFNVKIAKNFHSIDEISADLQFDEDLRPLVAPKETLQKHFRWFYTCYSFKAVYPTIPVQQPVPIDRYLSKSEQKLWFQGDLSGYAGLNGIELKEEMDDIELRFGKWSEQIDSLNKARDGYLDSIIEKLYAHNTEYELILPGNLIFSNAPVNRQDTLVWKVNAFRFTTDDYELIAESRTVHIWAFVIAFLLVALSTYCLIRATQLRNLR
ncbi:MAG: hypothetical protein LBU62_05365 [Bacteroidales bacterium]|jgi:hypothetical protein|nr:hypothetical protein [Bacteroidales bacterium]